MNIFDWTHWKVSDLAPIHDQIIDTCKANIIKIKAIKAVDRNFENTVLALSHMAEPYDDIMYAVHFVSNIHTEETMRNEAQKLEESVSKAMIDITLDRELYVAFMEYYNGNYDFEKSTKTKLQKDNKVETSRLLKSTKIKDIEKGKALEEKIQNKRILNDEEIKMVTDTHMTMSRMGFALDRSLFLKYKKKLQELSTLSQNFRIAINNYEDHILCTRAQLDGLSERYVKSLSCKDGLYKVTLSYPDAGPFMSYAKDRSKRKELSDKISQKGGKENISTLKKMLKLRTEISDILGYKNYVDYKVEDRMAKNLKGVQVLLKSTKKNIKAKLSIDIKELKAHAKTLNLNNLEYFDQAFVMKNLEETKYGIETEKLREYFETDRVLDHMLKLFGSLFAFKAIEIEPASVGLKVWHKSVRVYQILNDRKRYKLNHATSEIDENGTEIMSYLMLDLYPRKGKYSHAAAFNLSENGTRSIGLVCNFPAPSADVPSLLSLNEVETLYHEFGHATHFMLADTQYSEHNGFHVAWDFVESPSQMLEEWVIDEYELSKLAKHHETGKSLSIENINKVIASKKYMSGLDWMRQITMSELDLDLHLNKSLKELSPEIYYRELYAKNIGLDQNSNSLFPASFGHLDGYDAGYYSYLWAKVYALDFYSKFNKAKKLELYGVDNKGRSGTHSTVAEVGLRYRREVLGAGSSRDEAKSAKAFLGREMNDKAFIDSL